jgi:hypothetical protein
MQSLHPNKFGVNRKVGIMSTNFESVEKTQTSFQKEERFTVQNKLTDASPYQGTNPKSKAFLFDTNPYMPSRTVRCAKQENESD